MMPATNKWRIRHTCTLCFIENPFEADQVLWPPALSYLAERQPSAWRTLRALTRAELTTSTRQRTATLSLTGKNHGQSLVLSVAGVRPLAIPVGLVTAAHLYAEQRKMAIGCSMHYESVKGCNRGGGGSAFGATTPCFLSFCRFDRRRDLRVFLFFRKARKFRGGQPERDCRGRNECAGRAEKDSCRRSRPRLSERDPLLSL